MNPVRIWLVASFFIAGVGSVEAADTTLRDFLVKLFDGDDLTTFIHPDEYSISNRLGTTYEGVINKVLIGYDFPVEVKDSLRSGLLKYQTDQQQLDDGFLSYEVSVPSRGLCRRFIFKDGLLVSPVYYYTRQWARRESGNFRFILSDTTLFHPAAVDAMEKFFELVSSLLAFTGNERALIANDKIVYVYCKDENEIELLTGHRSRGMYVLAYDYIVSTYSCHFHELMHLLINFKLHHLPLYTHPFLQEGFAVAYGGRGGIAVSTFEQTGQFLVETGTMDYSALLSVKGFAAHDASMSYPVSGLYTRFLIESMGVARFLDLYRKYSVDEPAISSLVINGSDLPVEIQWKKFLSHIPSRGQLSLTSPGEPSHLIVDSPNVRIEEGEQYYHILCSSSFGLIPPNVRAGYVSKKFNEQFPGRSYRGERYAFLVDSTEATVFDLYVNTSIAAYSSGLSLVPQNVDKVDGKFEFWVRKEAFPIPMSGMVLSTFDSLGTQ